MKNNNNNNSTATPSTEKNPIQLNKPFYISPQHTQTTKAPEVGDDRPIAFWKSQELVCSIDNKPVKVEIDFCLETEAHIINILANYEKLRKDAGVEVDPMHDLEVIALSSLLTEAQKSYIQRIH